MKSKQFLFFLLLGIAVFANPTPPHSFNMGMNEPTLNVQNRILAQVIDKTISVLDVKKKMDLIFYKSHPNLVNSKPARYQFYQLSWRAVLEQMINTELMIADSESKELKLSDGDVHEEMMQRFGPTITRTLEEIGLTFIDAKDMVKNEMIVQRMVWLLVHSKAESNVHPEDIRLAYQEFLQKNPPAEKWSYQVFSIRDSDPSTAEKLYTTLSQAHQETETIITLFQSAENVKVNLSKEYVVESQNLSDLHKDQLKDLKIGEYSKPTIQKSRYDQEETQRIFYLKDFQRTEAPEFDKKYTDLQEELYTEQFNKCTAEYMQKLRKQYNFELDKKALENIEPFTFQ